MFRKWFSAIIALSMGFAVSASALEAPQSRTILTVTGAIVSTNVGDSAEFDRAMLEDLEWREIESHTSFTEGPQRFAGPTLASLLEALGVEDGILHASAINDYTVEIPVGHAELHNVILAMDMNGRAMRVRTKGPIWVVYPMSARQAADKSFNTEMIWQLDRIRVAR